jgi:Tfp pilus assembly protein FimV
MIVTRRRRKAFPWKRVLYPALAAILLGFALWWTPSRTWIADGPVTSPVWRATAPVWKPLSAPFDMAAQSGTIRAQSSQIDALGKQLADARAQIADRDKQITSLQSQLDQAQQQAAVANASKPAPRVTADGSAATPVPPSDLSNDATPGMRRTAQVWGAMDSEAAAKVVQKLPDSYVARIFALMTPDQVGAILENLPATYAARLTAERPELKR